MVHMSVRVGPKQIVADKFMTFRYWQVGLSTKTQTVSSEMGESPTSEADGVF